MLSEPKHKFSCGSVFGSMVGITGMTLPLPDPLPGVLVLPSSSDT